VGAEPRIVLVPIVEAIITARDDVRPGADFVCAVYSDDPTSDGLRKIKVLERRAAAKNVASFVFP
jgi:hypothetical protein